MAKFKGIYQYTGDEAGNISMGQLGFRECQPSGTVGTEGDKSGDTVFVAIKAVLDSTSGSSTSEVSFTAETLIGDDLTTTVLNPGDMIWGAFNYVENVSGTNMKLLCYLGK